ncbi:RDD family protein [Pantanalinema sp. GBBB05]|uniref:RDD family protein n=1 Tax=Pantanalinema sp. GBBB05 TaxID=2604139 RepID=UPI001D1B36EE|nr:RDD family protein [Pantanalinema sp. GBBB05]
MRFFNHISFSTPESVELEFVLAGIGNRTLALVIDYHILGAILVGFWILWYFFAMGLFSVLSQSGGDYSDAPLWLLAISLLINFAIYNGYFVFFETVWRGQTPGKRITKIRVVQDDGRPIGLPQAALRSILRLVDDFLFIGLFCILLGKREKRIGDWAAGTIVVQDSRSDPNAAIVISDVATELAATLPETTDFAQLLPDDYAIIREYLQRRQRMEVKARSELSLKLARQLRSLILMETIPPNLTSDQFLEAVYLAYQQQSTSADIRSPLNREN